MKDKLNEQGTSCCPKCHVWVHLIRTLSDLTLVTFLQRVDPSASGGESSYLQIEGRKRKMAERSSIREDSISQSPPSSPLFAPKRIHARSSQFWEGDESSYTESDVDEGTCSS